MRWVIVIVLSLVVVAAVQGAEFTLGAGNDDCDATHVHSNGVDDNYSLLSEIQLYLASGGGRKRGLVQWSELKDSLVDRTVSAATLYLHCEGTSDPTNGFCVRRVLTPWVEGEATWNSRRTDSVWSTAGCLGSGTDMSADSIGQFVAADTNSTGWWVIDVTSIVQAWDGSDTANCLGFVLCPAATPSYETINLDSDDSGTPGDRPYITITYEGTEAQGRVMLVQ